MLFIHISNVIPPRLPPFPENTQLILPPRIHEDAPLPNLLPTTPLNIPLVGYLLSPHRKKNLPQMPTNHSSATNATGTMYTPWWMA